MADGAYGEYAYGEAAAFGTSGDAAATGTSAAAAVSSAIAASAGSASGASSISSVGVTARRGVGSTSGLSTASGDATPNAYGYGLSAGFSTAFAVSPTKASFTGAGSSTAAAVGFANIAVILPEFAGASEQIALGQWGSRPMPNMVCSRIGPSSFNAGPNGSYSYNPTPGKNHCGPEPTPAPNPFPPLVYSWSQSKQNARVVDMNAVGNLILIGRAGALFGGDSLVYLSSDKGGSWIKMPLAGDNLVNVTMNAAGNLMAAYPLDTQYTYSSFDAGASWAANPRPWTTNQTNGVEIAKDGSRTILTANPGNLVYLSANNGISWESKDTGLLPSYEFFTCCCASFNNRVMFAGRSLDKMYRSLNGGASWAVCSNSFASQFSKVACDWSGNYVIATSQSTTTWWQVSRDGGTTWTKYGAGSPYLTCAVSGNGRVMAAATYGGSLFLSTDFGLTWANVNIDGVGGTYLWTDIAINYDGAVIAACAIDGPLFIGSA